MSENKQSLLGRITSDPFCEPRFFAPTQKSIGPAYYVIDETETHGFAFAPKGAAAGKKYCVFKWKRISAFSKSRTIVQWGGSLQEVRPQDWGFNMAKIRAMTQKPKKRTGPKR